MFSRFSNSFKTFSSLGPLAATALLLSGCASTALGARFSCLQWKTQGQMFSTLDSCVKCVQGHGAASLEEIQGCALGMDASALFELSQPSSLERNAAPQRLRH